MDCVAVGLPEGLSFLSFAQHSWSQPGTVHCSFGSKYNRSWFSVGVATVLVQIATGLKDCWDVHSFAEVLWFFCITEQRTTLENDRRYCGRGGHLLWEAPPTLTASPGCYTAGWASFWQSQKTKENKKKSLLSLETVLLVLGPKDQTCATLKVSKCN